MSKGKLGQNLIDGVNSDGGRFVTIPSFLASCEGQKEAIGRRQCTKEYKIRPIEQSIRRDIVGLAPSHPIPSEVQIEQLYGLSYDEAGRVARVKARTDQNNWAVLFPLFEMEMTRKACLKWLAKHYPGREVPRSACVFCPYRRNEEWRKLKESDPQGWARAVEIDNAIRDSASVSNRGLKAQQYVHESCVPLDQADLRSVDQKEEARGQLMFGFSQECEGMCGV